MSTRGWYEFYVVDEKNKEVTLALQFYKWGDATWGNALWERRRLEELVGVLEGVFPTRLVEALLEHNLGGQGLALGGAFHTCYYAYLLLRAAHEVGSPLFSLSSEWLSQIKTLSYEVGRAEAQQGYQLDLHKNPVIQRAHLSIAVGRLVRPWSEYQSRISLLNWLHFITMPGKEIEMGHILGESMPSFDIDYRHRFFFSVQELTPHAQRIERIRVQVCDPRGEDLRDALTWELQSPSRGEADEVMMDYRRSRASELEKVERALQQAAPHIERLSELMTSHRLTRGIF